MALRDLCIGRTQDSGDGVAHQSLWSSLVWEPYSTGSKKVRRRIFTAKAYWREGVNHPSRFRVEGERCGPDGSRQAGILADALNPSAPLGTLIGKIGGSPADKSTSSFVAGTGFLAGTRYLLHDRDSKYCASFRQLICSRL